MCMWMARTVGDVGNVVVRDRQMLARDGILMVVVSVDRTTGELVAGPDVVSRGFVYMRQSDDLIDATKNASARRSTATNGNGQTETDAIFVTTARSRMSSASSSTADQAPADGAAGGDGSLTWPSAALLPGRPGPARHRDRHRELSRRRRHARSRHRVSRHRARAAGKASGGWLTPQRQREFFALLLIGIGVLLLVLLLSSNAGAIGQFVSQGVQQAFGRGAAVVPLLLIVVGGLLIWQERIVDAPVSGSNVAGILLMAVAVLAMLEPKDLDEFVPLGTGGGMVGRGIDYVLVSAFGAAGTWTVLWLVLVFAILLTFNVTLRQFFEAIQSFAAGMWHLVVGVRVPEPERDTLTIEPVPFSNELKQPRKPAREREALPKPQPQPPKSSRNSLC